MRIFGNNKVLDWVQKKGMADDEALTHRWLNKALETAQGKVEARNFEIRKNLLRFDDVMNAQRQEIYKERIELMGTEDVSDTVAGMRRDVVDSLIKRTIPEGVYAEQWKVGELKDDVQRIFGLDLPVEDWAKEEGIAEADILKRVMEAAKPGRCRRRAERFGPQIAAYVEEGRSCYEPIDHLWREHIVNLDHLRSVIGFRGYAQRDPLQEYKGRRRSSSSDFAGQPAPDRHRATDACRTGPRRPQSPAAALPEMEGRHPARRLDAARTISTRAASLLSASTCRIATRRTRAT